MQRGGLTALCEMKGLELLFKKQNLRSNGACLIAQASCLGNDDFSSKGIEVGIHATGLIK